MVAATAVGFTQSFGCLFVCVVAGANHCADRGISKDQFKVFEKEAHELGFTNAAIGAMVRSSYHADEQAAEALREPHGGCSHH